MFRALTCTSSGGKIVFTQHLVSSLSVNVCPVHWSKHVEDNSVTNIFLTNKENCALKLVDEIILYYDARQKKTSNCFSILSRLITFSAYNLRFPLTLSSPIMTACAVMLKLAGPSSSNHGWLTCCSGVHDAESNHERHHAVRLSNSRWRHALYGGQSDAGQAHPFLLRVECAVDVCWCVGVMERAF